MKALTSPLHRQGEEFLKRIKRKAISALLTTTVPEMKLVIEELRARGLRNRVKMIVGGAPVDVAFAERSAPTVTEGMRCKLWPWHAASSFFNPISGDAADYRRFGLIRQIFPTGGDADERR